ncbi:MAG: polyphosphate polymerase domain-containing protein, partial [Flavobacteriales bacterium]|nr:polyphosphate polymerase domain-containing protein [Flavobacteriales bacterium]
MDAVQLMNRTDTKFILSRKNLAEILAVLPEHYRVLAVNDVRLNRYETLYYDREDFHYYRQHQNGKRNRYKIRKRSYVDSNLTYFEVKFKSNKDRTDKQRTKLSSLEESLEEKSVNFLHEATPLEDTLVPKLYNSFRRITLVNEAIKERLTIDTDIRFQFEGRSVSLPHLVIAEVKQEKVNRHSPFMKEIKKRLIRPESISK